MKRPGFTLIELLIVIAVIALLVALSIPVLHGSRQRARTLVCGSRIKQLTLGLTMYEEDSQTFPYGFFDTFTPPPGGYVGSPAYDRMGWWWFHFVEGCDGADGMIFRCPSKRLNDPRLKSSILYGNYGVNRSICKSPDDIRNNREEFVGTPLAGTDIPQPSRTLLIVDCGYSITSWWYATDVPPVPLSGAKGEDAAYVPGLGANKNKKLPPSQERDAIDGRHPNKTVNVGFADAHSDRMNADDLFVEKAADAYTNRIPLWSPQ
jgi:prepilin-type N-terminal cleavage/methylation domain-containing protein/prepilin-type processing-associated H-X9-DG protein